MKKIDEFIAGKLIEACGKQVNVSPVIAKENVKLPLIIYACESFEAVHTKTKLEGYWSNYTIDIYTETHEEGSALSDKVIDALDGVQSEIVEQCTIESGSVDYTTCYIHTLKFRLAHE
ncbi:hypothetical protein H8784_15740 [Parabacteroides acidifaciens]|uniref:DUF3168 domain-containing protein n=1 Tax=Parabacteroides acidifaciens TaxID=2290935 RepID=A0A3D8HAS7_9BACT|nr:hypothetical protein [Parabacteroides acidifaciens]MBC8603163.1 hypothetical protein [Parabacteroides acidifaciens]RDU48095.1 hypothetical protein DWU89_16130 [Parabacteroides acidifaciens]